MGLFNKKSKQKETDFQFQIVNEPEELDHPLVLRVTNPSEEAKAFCLFGPINNLMKPNFGNDPALVLENLQSDEGYDSLLLGLMISKSERAMIRIQSNIQENLKQTLTLKHSNPLTGWIYSSPVKLQVDPYQFQANIIDLPKRKFFPSDTSILGSILPNSSIVFSIFLAKENKENINVPFPKKPNIFKRFLKWLKNIFIK